MKVKKISKTTTNRGEFNRAHKAHLERKGKIKCSYCRPNRGCNRRNSYGGFVDNHIKYPSWKLTTKNRKQWMKKSIKYKRTTYNDRRSDYVEIKW